MKLVTIQTADVARLGVLDGESVIDPDPSDPRLDDMGLIALGRSPLPFRSLRTSVDGAG